MKYIFVIILIGLSLTKEPNEEQDLVAKINSMNTTWKAKNYGNHFRSFFIMNKYYNPDNSDIRIKEYPYTNDLPKQYDLRKIYTNCETVTEIRDQANCGSCWAFGSTEVMSDRLCIHSKGKLQTRVSPLYVLSCCKYCGNGCLGGYHEKAYEYWKNNGIPSGGLYGDKKSCQPYHLPECDDHPHKCVDYKETPKCSQKCIPEFKKSLNEDKSYGKDAYRLSGENNMMQEIIKEGPISVLFDIFGDFQEYSSGIYQHVAGKFKGRHVVKVLGWGEENGIKYWICANSWNPRWGESGYFRIIKGKNECNFERWAAAGIPKL